MSNNSNYTQSMIPMVVEKLCDPQSYRSVMYHHHHDMPMPSVEALSEAVEILRGALFPGYYGVSELTPETMRFHIGAMLDKAFRLLREQVKRGFCYVCTPETAKECNDCDERAREVTNNFMSRIPDIRRLLSTDVQAAFEGDPAARSPGETIYCYPSISAMTNYRIAHELRDLGVELIPRIITEIAHSHNGIDIHPGARIGERFFMDHGTGIVIGETSEIGRNVRIYQGVTLGAKSFPKDEHGNLIKGIPRHPIVEDDVIIYSGATILGRIRIGKGAVIGGNLWVTEDVPPGGRLLQDQGALGPKNNK